MYVRDQRTGREEIISGGRGVGGGGEERRWEYICIEDRIDFESNGWGTRGGAWYYLQENRR